MRKYWALFTISLKDKFSSPGEVIARSIFFAVIMYIFSRLWATMAQNGILSTSLANSRAEARDLVWYLLITESIMLSLPPLPEQVDYEIQTGDIAYQLVRPLDYVGNRAMGYLGDVAARFLMNIGVGILVTLALVGWPSRAMDLWIVLPLIAGAFLIHLGISLSISMLGFWVEDTLPFFWIYSKATFILGGLFMPIDFYPHWLQTLCRFSPLRDGVYSVAQIALGAQAAAQAGPPLQILLRQGLWAMGEDAWHSHFISSAFEGWRREVVEHMSFAGLLRFSRARIWMNIKSSFEYRASFWSQILFMIANNAFLLWFWKLFFQHFGRVRDWSARDMYLLYGISATAFGLANLVAGNAIDLAGTVANGELDYFIGLPPPTLYHALTTKIRVSALGDFLFGVVLLSLLYHDDVPRLALSLAVCVPAALVFTSVAILGASLAFFLGESRGITFQFVNLLMTFSTYPEAVFQGNMRWVLYLLIPAGFFSHLPAFAIHQSFLSLSSTILALGKLVGGAAGFSLFSVWVFHRGLRRYTSGSSIAIRI